MHRAEEDYLKIIYKHTIEADLEVVKTSVIANTIVENVYKKMF